MLFWLEFWTANCSVSVPRSLSKILFIRWLWRLQLILDFGGRKISRNFKIALELNAMSIFKQIQLSFVANVYVLKATKDWYEFGMVYVGLAKGAFLEGLLSSLILLWFLCFCCLALYYSILVNKSPLTFYITCVNKY